MKVTLMKDYYDGHKLIKKGRTIEITNDKYLTMQALGYFTGRIEKREMENRQLINDKKMTTNE